MTNADNADDLVYLTNTTAQDKSLLFSPGANNKKHGVMVIIVGIGHGNTSSNPRRD